MMKCLIFDMDGTIADLYGADKWLEKIQAEKTDPYIEAEPLYDMESLNNLLRLFKQEGWRIIVTSWLAGGSPSEAYNLAVKAAKLDWLKRYKFPFDEIHIVEYGTPKETCTYDLGGYQILIDDNPEIRNSWRLGGTINANKNIIAELRKYLTK